jgi:hypothetical protein
MTGCAREGQDVCEDRSGNIIVTSPEPDVFAQCAASIEEVRRITAAVIAFSAASRPSAEGEANPDLPHLSAELPVSFERKFRPWQYRVTHSELKLRSAGSPTEAGIIEVTFYGVVAMKLATVYEPLAIELATAGQAEEMVSLAGLKETQSSRVKVLALKSARGNDGLVACLSYSVWLHPSELKVDSSGLPKAESILILRG